MLAIIMDTETTGLIDNPAKRLALQPEIIEFSSLLVNLEEERIYDKFNMRFKPNKPISAEITRITGITNDDLINAPSIREYLDQILVRLNSAPLVIGQNIKFDTNMVELECQRYNKTIKWPPKIDLVQHAIYLKGYRLTLTDLHTFLFGSSFEKAHRADVDVQMTALCAIEMFKRRML